MPFIVNNGGNGGGGSILDYFWTFLPIICCLLLMMTSPRGGGARQEPTTETESWYTPQSIETTYESIEREMAEWRREAEERGEKPVSLLSRLRGTIGGKQEEERFIVEESIPPRLYRLVDQTEPIYFELTEVEGGGTVVKTTYNTSIKNLMAKFKARLPLIVPAAPTGNLCPACGKSVLPGFNLCPYCGEKLVEE